MNYPREMWFLSSSYSVLIVKLTGYVLQTYIFYFLIYCQPCSRDDKVALPYTIVSFFFFYSENS